MIAPSLAALVPLPLVFVVVACSSSTDDLDSGPPADTGGGVVVDTGVDDTPDSGLDAGVEEADSGPPDTGEPRDGGLIDPVAEPFRTLKAAGAPANRIDLVFVGDGYTQEQLSGTYASHVGTMADNMFSSRRRDNDTNEPFVRYRNFFNVHRVHVASAESGVDDAMAGTTVDTALDGRINCDVNGSAPCPLDFDKASAAVNAALSGSGIEPDVRFVVLNTSEDVSGSYFPGGTGWAVYGGGFNQAREMGLRELARVFSGAAYESGGRAAAYLGSEPGAINVTTSTGAEKWARWLGYNQPGLDNNTAMQALHPIGIYEGALGWDLGIYRPSRNSKMGTLIPGPFNAVVREQIILDLYARVRPVDGHPDNSQVLVNPKLLYVDLVDRTLFAVEWSVDGVLVPALTDPTFGPVAFGVPRGNHVIRVRVFDETTWVRAEDRSALEQSVEWNIRIE